MLLLAGGLASRAGTRLALSAAGLKALRSPPAELIRKSWGRWLPSTLVDEFSRVDAIKGQNSAGRVMSALEPRRAAIQAALQQCPVGAWIEPQELSRFMRASGLDFVVAHDPWKLYIGDRHYGSLGYRDAHDWNVLQDRYITAFLFEYAATLGLVDVAYQNPDAAPRNVSGLWGADDLPYLSRYDGLCAVRVTPLGAYVLGMAAGYQPQAPAATLAVMPSLAVNLVSGTLGPDDILLLQTWAEPLQEGSWRLDPQRVLAAVEAGHALAELEQFLQGHDETPLPEPVHALLKRCELNARALKLGAPAVLVECRDAPTAEHLSQRPETRALCFRADAQTLVVRADLLAKFRDRAHVLGLGLV